MRQLYPLRPLTEAGRVLVCIAASLFAALLLVAWSAAPAETDDRGDPVIARTGH